MARRFNSYLGAFVIGAVICPVLPVNAGFEFVAPINQEPVQTRSQAPQIEIIEESVEVEAVLPLMPVEEKVDTQPLPILPTDMKMKETVVPTVQPIEKERPPVAPLVKAPPVEMAAPSLPEVSEKAVQGFANQIPLVIALQQIMPPQYQYAFADGVNPGQKVDWQGGKPWQDVVSDMLSSKGMVADISGDVVYIRSQNQSEVIMKEGDAAPAIEKAAEPLPLLPLLPTEKKAAVTSNKKSLLFDDPDHAELAGVTPSPKPKTPSLIVSDRLELGDLSIGQPMQLIPSKADAIKKEAKPIIVETTKDKTSSVDPKILMAQSEKPVFAPQVKKPQPKPVKNKKILLFDEADTKEGVANRDKSLDPMSVAWDESMPEAPVPSEESSEVNIPDQSEVMMSMMADEGAAEVDAEKRMIWQGKNGQTLRSILKEWSEKSGVSLIWESNYDYPLQADIDISGTYEHAVRTILDGLADAQPRPIGRLHYNEPAGQPVLVIETATLTQ